MKNFLALGNRIGLNRTTAHSCMGTNLALPGVGSLLAGRTVGYAQAALTLTAFVLTMLFGVKFLVWYLTHWSVINSPEADPVETLLSVWRQVRWALLGMGVFAVAWLWAMVTSVSILRQARRSEASVKPPKLS